MCTLLEYYHKLLLSQIICDFIVFPKEAHKKRWNPKHIHLHNIESDGFLVFNVAIKLKAVMLMNAYRGFIQSVLHCVTCTLSKHQ